MASSKRLSPNAATKPVADLILTRHHFAQDAGERLYAFSEGAYRDRGEQYLRRCIKEQLRGKWSRHQAGEIVEFIRTDAPLLWERPPLDIINVKNGLLHIKTRTLSPHRPDFLSKIQLPVDFDPAAICPAWEKFIQDTFPGDSQMVPWEIAAWLMIPTKEIQRAVLLLGGGSNGKSTFLRACIAFLGRANVSTLSLHKLEEDRFAPARLIGKLANICPDLPNKHLESMSEFKAITGDDLITGEYKYSDSFDFLPFARLLFSANQPPRSSDSSKGFFRRWLPISFSRTFPEDPEKARALDTALADPKELSGVLNKALDALPQVLKRGITIAASMQSALNSLKQATDPLAVWIDAETVDDPTAFVLKKCLVTAYKAYCVRTGRAPMTAQSFGRALKRLRPDVREAQRVVEGKREWAYLGIR